MRYRKSITHMSNMMHSTQNHISVMRRGVGRKKRWSEDMVARFPDGTFERIAAVLDHAEDRTDFVRAAVDRELRRREKAAEKKAYRK